MRAITASCSSSIDFQRLPCFLIGGDDGIFQAHARDTFMARPGATVNHSPHSMRVAVAIEGFPNRSACGDRSGRVAWRRLLQKTLGACSASLLISAGVLSHRIKRNLPCPRDPACRGAREHELACTLTGE